MRSPTSNAEGEKVVEPHGPWLTGEGGPGVRAKGPCLGGTSESGSGQPCSTAVVGSQVTP